MDVKLRLLSFTSIPKTTFKTFDYFMICSRQLVLSVLCYSIPQTGGWYPRWLVRDDGFWVCWLRLISVYREAKGNRMRDGGNTSTSYCRKLLLFSLCQSLHLMFGEARPYHMNGTTGGRSQNVGLNFSYDQLDYMYIGQGRRQYSLLLTILLLLFVIFSLANELLRKLTLNGN